MREPAGRPPPFSSLSNDEGSVVLELSEGAANSLSTEDVRLWRPQPTLGVTMGFGTPVAPDAAARTAA